MTGITGHHKDCKQKGQRGREMSSTVTDRMHMFMQTATPVHSPLPEFLNMWEMCIWTWLYIVTRIFAIIWWHLPTWDEYLNIEIKYTSNRQQNTNSIISADKYLHSSILNLFVWTSYCRFLLW